jgi:hypothetical protein
MHHSRPRHQRVTDFGSVPGIGTNLMNRETFFLPGRRAIVISSCRSVKFLPPKIRRHCRQCWLRVSTLTMIADVPKLLQRCERRGCMAVVAGACNRRYLRLWSGAA